MPDNKIRPMSIHEASFPVYASRAPGAANLTASIELQAKIEPVHVETALDKLYARHPLLRVGYKDINEYGSIADYWFISPEGGSIPVDYRTVATENEFHEAVDKAHHELYHHNFLHGELLSRAIFIKVDSEQSKLCMFLYCISHAVADGTSIITIMQEWVKLVDQQIGSTHFDELEDVLPLNPPLWDSMPPVLEGTLGILGCLGVLLKMVGGQRQADKGLGFAVEVPAPSEEHRLISRSATIPEEQFELFRKKVKEKDCSLHGAIAAAYYFAFVDYLSRNETSRQQLLKKKPGLPVTTTVDVRRTFNPPIGAGIVSCHSSAITSEVFINYNYLAAGQDPPASYYWDVANQISKGLIKELMSGQHWKILRTYKLAGIKGLTSMLVNSAEKPLATPLCYVNMGKVEFHESEALTVSSFALNASFTATGPGMNVGALCFKNKLTLGASCTYPMALPSTLHQFIDDAVKHLKRMIVESESTPI